MGVDLLDPVDRDRNLSERHGTGRIGKVIRWIGHGPEFGQMLCGLEPQHAWQSPFGLVRSEGRRFENRCLIVANEFYVSREHERYRVTLAGSDPYFCFAGVWQPASSSWPNAYAGITAPASPDLALLKDRQQAIVRKEDWHGWLQGLVSEDEALAPLPAGSLNVIRVRR